MTTGLAELRLQDFENLVGQQFVVLDSENRHASLTLKKVERLKHSHASRLEPFSLRFEGSSSTPMTQGTYTFQHEAIGSCEIFVVPLSDDQSTRQYEAIFN